MKKLLLTAAVIMACAISAPAHADGDDFLSLGIGYFDIMDNEEAVDVRAEWRSGNDLVWGIKPFIGAEATTDGAIYALGGLYRDFPLAPNWYLTPSFGAGFFHDGDGKDLGDPIEFRTQLEIQYEFASRNRVSLGASHISNAGLDDRNPGTEVVSFYYHMPWN